MEVVIVVKLSFNRYKENSLGVKMELQTTYNNVIGGRLTQVLKPVLTL